MEARQGRIQTCVSGLTLPADLIPRCLAKLLALLAQAASSGSLRRTDIKWQDLGSSPDQGQIGRSTRPSDHSWPGCISLQICYYFLPIFNNTHLVRSPVGVALLGGFHYPPTQPPQGAIRPPAVESLHTSLKVNPSFHGKQNNSAFPVCFLLLATG